VKQTGSAPENVNVARGLAGASGGNKSSEDLRADRLQRDEVTAQRMPDAMGSAVRVEPASTVTISQPSRAIAYKPITPVGGESKVNDDVVTAPAPQKSTAAAGDIDDDDEFSDPQPSSVWRTDAAAGSAKAGKGADTIASAVTPAASTAAGVSKAAASGAQKPVLRGILSVRPS